VSYQDIQYDLRDKTAVITLNRPDKLNALGANLLDELDRALAEAEADDRVAVIVIRGAGRAFCAGYDLEPGGATTAEALSNPVLDRKRLAAHQRHWWKIWDCAKPVIARVHGYCLAGGTELAMMCDLVVAADNAQFGYPPLRDMGSPVTPIWPWLIGARWAKLLYFTGDSIDGRTAERIGMINFSVPEDRLDEAVELLAGRMAKVPVDLLTLHKGQVNRALEIMGIRAALASGPEFDALGHASKGARQAFFEPVAEKGLRHLLEKRAGLFPGSLFQKIEELKSKG